MKISVRRLTAADRADWLRLFRGYIAFYEATVPEEVVEATFRRMTSGDPHAHIGLIAVDETGRGVGIAHVLMHPSTWSPTCYCYLEDLFTDPDARGKGVGRALIEAVYGEADQAGATRTYWHTAENNYTARQLYDRVGVKSPFIQYRRRQGWKL